MALVSPSRISLYDYFYDALGRRRMKVDPFSNGTEFMYDLGHQLLVDQVWFTNYETTASLDEYVWLDGRPVVAFRGNLNPAGGHWPEELSSAPQAICYRPGEEGNQHCGAYHLVSNQQNFVVLALSDYDGKVASFALPDADGVINQARFVSFGGYGTSFAEAFDVPETFSKEARFRTVYTGGWQTDWWGFWGGISEMRLTAPGGAYTAIYPAGSELGRTTGPWSPTMIGNQNVTWSTVCSTNCASAADVLEWRVWETGGPKFNTRLRFPGQYHDAETDFYENWNRFYDPTTGRYLSPEPFLSRPLMLRRRVHSEGESVPPSFAYAGNNSVGRIDEDALLDYRIRCPSKRRGIKEWWIHLPGSTPCDDCADLAAAAPTYCAITGSCNCEKIQDEADKACRGCQSKQPPPSTPKPPLVPLPPMGVACR